MRIALTGLLLVAAAALPLVVAARSQPVVMPVGKAAPPLHAVMLNGRDVPSWAALRGKIVIVDFWASWCTPCLAAFPKFNEFADAYRSRDIEFFSVTYEPADYIRTFLQKHPLHTAVAIDDSFAAFKAYNAWGIPVAYLFDRRGRLIAAVHPDELDTGAIDSVLKRGNPHLPAAQPWSDPHGAEKYFRSLLQELKTSEEKADKHGN